ncbi:probable apyrase 7 isoform X2 [Diospyros lotus]|uniref:probable apyrase 7 isoform X2 n=1 Tax=Diospyros lotus TaxID=55363 RepID=UPI0022530BA7|nr:probable apyrase 7 isoform X2 [Diospyros lotus]
MEPRAPSKFKFPVSQALLFILLLPSVSAHVVSRSSKTQYMPRRSFFTVVVDCGSTGTRLTVYEWIIKGDLSDGGWPVMINSFPDNYSNNSHWSKDGCRYHCLQTEPGLDKFVGNSSGVRVSLEPLIEWAEQWVPPERHGDTPIFVLATAGLRRLSREDARRVLEDVEAIVKEHSFVYRKSWIRILSGKEEAYYGWVALNYKLGSFNKFTKLPTLGVLDLGGSSLQVVAEVDESKDDEHFLRSKVGFVEHQILAYSLPAFGLNEAFDRSVVMLSHSDALRESVGGTFEVSHPCLGSSFVQNYTCSGCFVPTSTDLGGSHSQLQRNKLDSVLLVGDPNWEQCKVLARAAAINSSSYDWQWLTESSMCKTGWASSNGSEMLNLAVTTHPVARFHALSGFYAVYTMLNLESRANLTKIWEKGQQICSKSWHELNSISGNQNDKEIIFGPGDVSWTMGAALVEGELLWRSSSRDETSILTRTNTGVISKSIFLLFVLVCLLFIVYHRQVKLPMPSRKKAAVGALSLPSFVPSNLRPN